jgi:hypothetical protein
MARLQGTGRDPLGQYGEGVVFDVPRTDPLYDELIANGHAEPVRPADDPAMDSTQVANRLVRGEPVDQHPGGPEHIENIGARAHDIVHTQDPDAPLGAASPDPAALQEFDAANRATYDTDQLPPSGEEEAVIPASGAVVREGDLATHTGLTAEDSQPGGEPLYPSDPGVEAALQDDSADAAATGGTVAGAEGGTGSGAATADGEAGLGGEAGAAEGDNTSPPPPATWDGVTEARIDQHAAALGVNAPAGYKKSDTKGEKVRAFEAAGITPDQV